MHKLLRQGDIIIEFGVDFDVSECTELPRDSQDRIVLAYGEVTGHAHAVLDKHVRCVQNSDGVYLINDVADMPIVIEHEEHKAITVPAGVRVARVHRQREWTDVDEPRSIAD